MKMKRTENFETEFKKYKNNFKLALPVEHILYRLYDKHINLQNEKKDEMQFSFI